MHHLAHGSATPGWVGVVNMVANLAIIGGYLIVPLTVLARLPLTRFVRISGIFFFLCCALTHLSMAAMPDPAPWLAINHVMQAVAVWCFVIGFAALVREANRRRRAERRGRRGAP
jgi:hypothetical protein